MATIQFRGNLNGAAAGTDPGLIDQSLSGIGFFGGAFGLSVPVGSHQDSTFITNSDGTTEAQQLQNTKYASESGVKFNTNNENDNEAIPNYYTPLNLRFTHNEAVRVKNCQLRIFDRSDITKNASGVTTQVYEVRHPNTTQNTNSALDFRGTAGLNGKHGWATFLYDGQTNEVTPYDMTPSPGMSGLNGNETDQANSNLDGTLPYTYEAEGHQSVQHDWYVALSASPNGIGSKTDFGLYFTLEYL